MRWSRLPMFEGVERRNVAGEEIGERIPGDSGNDRSRVKPLAARFDVATCPPST